MQQAEHALQSRWITEPMVSWVLLTSVMIFSDKLRVVGPRRLAVHHQYVLPTSHIRLLPGVYLFYQVSSLCPQSFQSLSPIFPVSVPSLCLGNLNPASHAGADAHAALLARLHGHHDDTLFDEGGGLLPDVNIRQWSRGTLEVGWRYRL